MPKKDPNRPKRGLTAFMFYSQGRRKQLKLSAPTLAFGDVAKLIGGEWKKLQEHQKIQYHIQSAKDKERFNVEMQSYIPPTDDKSRKKKRKFDKNAPKRSKSAYLFFVAERRPNLVSENPSWNFGDYGKHLGVEWRSMVGDKRAKWDKMASNDKLRYQAAMAKYKEHQPNVTTVDKVSLPDHSGHFQDSGCAEETDVMLSMPQHSMSIPALSDVKKEESSEKSRSFIL